MLPDWNGLTVAQLIATLSGMPGELPVAVRVDTTQLLEVTGISRGKTLERYLVDDETVFATGLYCLLDARRLPIGAEPEAPTD